MPIDGGRAVWIVLDGVGIGALPDAGRYGDFGAATLQHAASACGGLRLPALEALGLGHLADIQGVSRVSRPMGAFGRMQEAAEGKDSTTGHWELAGLVLDPPFACYPAGFPEDLIEAFSKLAGQMPLGNVAASGTGIIERFGADHVRSGRPIVYTSVDSVFQIAAHEEVLPVADLYALCLAVRKLADAYRIGRVIARPFVGDDRNGFRRTPRRRDFSMPPPGPTVLDRLSAAGHTICGVGKISDLFCGRGITRSLPSRNNADGMAKILCGFDELPAGGLQAASLIDFTMEFGHRRDAAGFCAALKVFDAWLPQLQRRLSAKDLLLITADHGCDPTMHGSDHTREYVPILAWQAGWSHGTDLGIRNSFSDLGATLEDFFGHRISGPGCSILPEISR